VPVIFFSSSAAEMRRAADTGDRNCVFGLALVGDERREVLRRIFGANDEIEGDARDGGDGTMSAGSNGMLA
jgi:hypothetical protein